MRILIATYWGLPSVGGLEKYIYQLKRGLEAQGHQVDIFSRMPDDSGYHMLNKGWILKKSHLLPLISAQAGTYFAKHIPEIDIAIKHMEIEKFCFEAAAAYFRPSTYDIIHTQDIFASRAFTRIGHPHQIQVATIHGCYSTESLARLLEQGIFNDQYKQTTIWHYFGFIEHLGIMRNAETILPTQWLKSVMSLDFHIPPDKMTVVPCGMDIEEFKQDMEKPAVTPDAAGKKVIICTSRFDPVKGHVHLLHALLLLKKERFQNDWVCWLVGDGQVEGKMRELAVSLGLQNEVVFLGKRHDVPALLKKADLFVLPSLQDNHPFAIMEAHVSGKPVIVSNAGGIPEMIIDGQTGLIFPAGDEQRLFAQLNTALNDEGLCRHLSEQSEQWGSYHWSLPVMTERTMAVYSRAMHKRKAEVREGWTRLRRKQSSVQRRRR
ncbi:glycosyltransferase family 4 protein [Paenibacillus alginolyticus]|uniref:glycosyltransferase family 4 protein n=1 Tax=Paenibacillus alginolyticus TaxID=59839 RepID=UPI0004029242|nr:glycosyltransferase family 4 protein [Paenibacillus alginolyticus]MCY9668261.1 glycosyltransferase family 4 protein [Paenibacillus alginolyticus]